VLFFQPILGFMHHLMFKKHHRRQIWSYGHLWVGRIFITLGIINGGLGLKLANNTRSGEIAYGVVAAIFWLLWMACAVYGEIKRARAPKPAAIHKGSHNGSESDVEGGVDAAAVNAPAHAAPMNQRNDYYAKEGNPPAYGSH